MVDAREWINRARSDLALARARGKGIYLEDLCFHAQQAAEKAIKALLIRHGIQFPYVHDLAALLTLLEKATGELPEPIRQAEWLTRFAVQTRLSGDCSARPGKGIPGSQVEAWAKRIGVHPREVRLRAMMRKWASCSTKGCVTFNNDLLRQPARFRAEAIVHELLHLKVPNHGKLFRALLRSYLSSTDRLD